MSKSVATLMLLIVITSTTSVGCIVSSFIIRAIHDKPEVAACTFVGTLDDVSVDDGTMTIDGIVYAVAEGMAVVLPHAVIGGTYEFTIDTHGSIICVIPVE